ncbi:MAG: glycine cleavage system aminomethyltransferase GcvT [Chloroflexi bacterium]|nr:glycine cleavage system aminomethyltransferase GcvT [Chloroflexota bacterium]
MPQTLLRTPLFDTHLALGGRMTPFAGWEMPIQYRDGILAEARAVRSASGLFDVSHMGRIFVNGPQAAALLDWVTTADVPKLALGQGRYTLICTEAGGILDDAIVYRLGEERFLLVCNASNRPAVWEWLQRWRGSRFPSVTLDDRTLEVGMIAWQGPATPAAMEALCPGLPKSLRIFRITQASIAGIAALVARTGYTGEDGFEIMPSSADTPALWERLQQAGATPCGLGARDILRLEAALPLHGNDISTATNPFEAGLDRFVSLDKESAATPALRQVLQRGLTRKLTGFRMTERGVPRHGYPILADGKTAGEVTSGGYSPTLDAYVGMGYVAVELAAPGSRFAIDIRGKATEAEVVALPFYSRRRG